jgi:glutamate racemase
MAEISQIRKVFSGRIVNKVQGLPDKNSADAASPIAMFDSGVGGLTVFEKLTKLLPNESVLYLADTARVPYGGRSAGEIIKINREILDYFVKQGAKIMIMACGTSSAIAYPELKDKYKVPMLGMIEGGAKMALSATKNKKIGVIATAGTINSGAYQAAIKKLDSTIQVFGSACPLLVPLIEGGFALSDETSRVLKDYLKPLLQENIDTLILGCTHYPHVIGPIKQIVGPNVGLVDPAEEAARSAKELLTKLKLMNDTRAVPTYTFKVTGPSAHFQELGSRLMGKPLQNVEELKLPLL